MYQDFYMRRYLRTGDLNNCKIVTIHCIHSYVLLCEELTVANYGYNVLEDNV